MQPSAEEPPRARSGRPAARCGSPPRSAPARARADPAAAADGCRAQLDQPAHALDAGRRGADPPQGGVVVAWPVRRPAACRGRDEAARPTRFAARTRRGRTGRLVQPGFEGPHEVVELLPGGVGPAVTQPVQSGHGAVCQRSSGQGTSRCAICTVVRRSQSASNTSTGSARKPGKRSCTSSSQPQLGWRKVVECRGRTSADVGSTATFHPSLAECAKEARQRSGLD